MSSKRTNSTLVVVTLLAAFCALAASQGTDPETGKSWTTNCTPGIEGDQYCQKTVGGADGSNPAACMPLKIRFPKGAYTASQGFCSGTYSGPTFAYNFKTFNYDPPANTWGGATQLAYIANGTCNNPSSQQEKCTSSYSATTAVSQSLTFTQSITVEADFTFKLGGCALCPAEADTTFKVAASVGFQENYASTNTKGFTSGQESDLNPKSCIVQIFSVNYINDLKAAFVADVEVMCSYTGGLSSQDEPFISFPCGDIAGALQKDPKFTATIVSVDPYSLDPNRKAEITLSGTQTASFGVSTNKIQCDCTDTQCIAKATASIAGSPSGGSVGQNAANLPGLKGVDVKGVGTAPAVAPDVKSCTTCASVNVVQSGGGGGGTTTATAPSAGGGGATTATAPSAGNSVSPPAAAPPATGRRLMMD